MLTRLRTGQFKGAQYFQGNQFLRDDIKDLLPLYQNEILAIQSEVETLALNADDKDEVKETSDSIIKRATHSMTESTRFTGAPEPAN